jgi:ABC-type transport system substrate-binding protein
MNKNIYLNVVMTVLGLLLIIVGYVFITSIDLSRKQQESMGGELRKLNVQLEKIQQCLDEQNRTLRGVKKVLRERPVIARESSSLETKKRVNVAEYPIANVEYYPKNGDDGGVIVSPIASETTNLNSMINNDSLASAIWSRCFDYLAERDLVNIEQFKPKLAVSWEISADKLVYTIHLPKNLFSHLVLL